MDGESTIECRGLSLLVKWVFEEADPEVGYWRDCYYVTDVFVLDDKGNQYGITIDDTFNDEISEIVKREQEEFAAMDREP